MFKEYFCITIIYGFMTYQKIKIMHFWYVINPQIMIIQNFSLNIN